MRWRTAPAAWAQMLNYVVTVAISAFFVPHYLGVFWAPLGEAPADIVVGIAVVAVLVASWIRFTSDDISEG